ncbi:site-specific integrase [Actinoplanes sp. CA-030573]|uniref:site-specific integrase n=1 Tax=Actinoplanes sp. CA-030573 TaxID=3239898 RepID=UPI003D8D9866
MDDAIREQLGPPLAAALAEFLTDLANGNASAHTIRAYRGDLLQFAAHHDAGPGELTVSQVRVSLPLVRRRLPRRTMGSGALPLPDLKLASGIASSTVLGDETLSGNRQWLGCLTLVFAPSEPTGDLPRVPWSRFA